MWATTTVVSRGGPTATIRLPAESVTARARAHSGSCARIASRTRHSRPGTPGRSASDRSSDASAVSESRRSAGTGSGPAGTSQRASAAATPAARATAARSESASASWTVSTSVPAQRARTARVVTESSRAASSPAGRGVRRHSTAPVRAAPAGVPARAAGPTMTTLSTGPMRASAPLRPAQRKARSVERTNTVSPVAGVPCAAAATAAQPARPLASAPAACPAYGQAGTSRRTGSMSRTPRARASAAERAPTSTQRSSTPTTAVSPRCCREKWPLGTATTPGTSPVAVRTSTCCAWCAWSQSGCTGALPARCRRR